MPEDGTTPFILVLLGLSLISFSAFMVSIILCLARRSWIDFVRWGYITLIMSIFIAFISFAILTNRTDHTVTKAISVEVTKGKNEVYVRSSDGSLYIFKSYEDYNKINDSTEFIRTSEYNYWGWLLDVDVLIK